MKDIIVFYFWVPLSVFSGIKIANVAGYCKDFFRGCSTLCCQTKFICKLCEDFKFCITVEIIRVAEFFFCVKVSWCVGVCLDVCYFTSLNCMNRTKRNLYYFVQFTGVIFITFHFLQVKAVKVEPNGTSVSVNKFFFSQF